ncbi:hypothetical protein [Spirillospora sp. NBC_01491]|uniref:hypothetical protein n=1 Tax=Spirillospora sp. NBC_01491 TaxID=2976007 RepID=UPI002E33EBD8|nr:hypothetical protein [Spirillospora sp. NBC_01491]
MTSEGHTTQRHCRRKAEALGARGFTVEQIAVILALDHPSFSPLRVYRCAAGLTARTAADLYNQADPAGTASLRESRLYDFEAWPDHGRRPPAWTLRLLARVYGTATRNLVTTEVYASYPPKEQEVVDAAVPGVASGRSRVSMERSREGRADALPWDQDPGPAASAPSPQATVELFHALSGMEADVKRRDLLFQLALALGGTAALPLLRRLPPAETERLARVVTQSGRVDAQTVTTIETLIAHCRQLDDTHGPEKVIAVIDAQRAVVGDLLAKGGMPEALRERLISVYANLSHLSGWQHFDLLDHAGAATRYDDGLRAAHELSDATLIAHLHGSIANMAEYRGQVPRALDHAYAAQGWVRSSTSPLQQGTTALMLARVLASAGKEKTGASLRAMARATEVADRIRSEKGPAHLYWWTPERVQHHAVFCHARLGRHDEALGTAEHTLPTLKRTCPREYAFAQLECAGVLIQKREIDSAAGRILAGMEVTSVHSSARLVRSVLKTREQLEPWAGSRHVREVDERLRGLGLVGQSS